MLASRQQVNSLNQSIQRATFHYTDKNRDDFVLSQAAASESDTSLVAEELFAMARSRGSIRVIVQLRVPHSPDGFDNGYEKAIQKTQHLVRTELAPVPHQIIRTFDSIPAIVVEASAEALRILQRSRHINRVDLDQILAPFEYPNG